MQPLQFEPILKRARWGGRRLETVLGKPIGPEFDYAESWEIADVGADQTVVAAGEFRDWPLTRLVAERRKPLLGRHHGCEAFPLLIKFLDAHDRLSVQVHPDDHQARRLGVGRNGKTEAWLIVEAEPGNRLYAGLKRSIDRRALVSHLDAGTVEECLHSFPVKPGDCVFIPAGTVHAIGEGILLAEIQQPSDATFRLFDWGRVGSDAKPRPLHRTEALACVDFNRGPVEPIVPRLIDEEHGHQVEELVRCDQFVLRRHRLKGEWRLPADDRFRVLMPLAGSLDVQWADGGRRLTLGDTLLVPAAAKEVIVFPLGEATALEAHLP